MLSPLVKNKFTCCSHYGHSFCTVNGPNLLSNMGTVKRIKRHPITAYLEVDFELNGIECAQSEIPFLKSHLVGLFQSHLTFQQLTAWVAGQEILLLESFSEVPISLETIVHCDVSHTNDPTKNAIFYCSKHYEKFYPGSSDATWEHHYCKKIVPSFVAYLSEELVTEPKSSVLSLDIEVTILFSFVQK